MFASLFSRNIKVEWNEESRVIEREVKQENGKQKTENLNKTNQSK